MDDMQRVPPSREVAHAEIDDRVAPQHAEFAKAVYDLLFRDAPPPTDPPAAGRTTP